MRVLIAHNRYQQSGGEDNVVSTEEELLRSHGHTVEVLRVDNDHIDGMISKTSAALGTAYSFSSRSLMKTTLVRFQPDLVHVHNFFPTLSPAVFRVCSHQHVPVVHTLHNFRIVCAAATLFRDDHVCEDCLKQQSPWPGVKHACYRQSRLGSAVSGLSMQLHAKLGTWRDDIDAYIALTEFSAEKLASRIPREKIHIKPNSCPDHGLGTGDGDYALFVGRLTVEKGVRTLIEADASGRLSMPLVVLGDGPLRAELDAAAKRPDSRLVVMGFQDRTAVYGYMKRARVLIMPSLWYEAGIPLVVLEALSMGLPIIAADLPNFKRSFPTDAGILYRAGDPLALSDALASFLRHHDVKIMRMSAREEYLRRYTPEANYNALIGLYEQVLSTARA